MTSKRHFRMIGGLAVVLVLIALSACAPQRQAVVMPTLARLPSEYRLEEAERTARSFLDRWREGDLDGMYALLSFNSQEANPRQDFTDLYNAAALSMALENIDYTALTITRDPQQDEIAVFAYDAQFDTGLVGTFSDPGRSLRLVVDQQANDWRVAWSPGDIFAGMEAGGRLRFDPVIPNRANIYDSDGTILADQNARVVIVSIVPDDVPDRAACDALLAEAIDRPLETVQALIESRPSNWLVEIGIMEAQTYLDQSAALESTCEATFNDRPARRYLESELAPHVIGYVGYPDPAQIDALEAQGFAQDAIIGRAGIELSWDSTLRGQPGGRLVVTGADGALVREIARATAQPGQSVWLTLDADLQRATQQIVADAYTQAKTSWAQNSNGASAIVMDVRTGAILALVSYPTFDNNAYTVFPTMGRDAAQTLIADFQSDPRRPELNRVTQGAYPLGSVMKTVSAAAAADSGVYALDERYTCTGIWSRDIPRYDWFGPGHGTLNLAASLTNSCNPYYYEVGYQLSQTDPYLLPTYARQLGFGGFSGLPDLPENPGLIGDPDWLQRTYGTPWTYSEEVNMAIGQGYVQVTPLQVVRWFSAIANGGSLPRPYLVSQVGLLGDPMRTAYEPIYTPVNLRPEVLATIREGLCAVTIQSSLGTGTAEFVFRDSPLQTLGVCGKTGTAQDEPRNSHAWFAAYAPRSTPEIAIVVMVENSGQGSEVAAPIARAIMEAYFGLTP
ncbi:MAG: penicillin-binding transpeptidase domain-containing protein [bacterium]|nr:penicillin-binding transpeptidase domain-containing protein [bacterium]